MMDEQELLNTVHAITKTQKELHRLLGQDLLDNWVISKHLKIIQKIKNFNYSAATPVFVGDHLKFVNLDRLRKSTRVLKKDFLNQPLDDQPRQCIYFLLNNDIGSDLERYKELFKARPCSIFIIWDWDSQHWLEMSCSLAAYCDFYFPVSSENTFTISHFNPFVLAPVFVGVNQWSKKFITDHFNFLLNDRDDRPYGPHVFYEAYARRNRAIATLNTKFEGIHFTNNNYKLKLEIDTFKEWSNHKTHWIIPVLSGLPIRVFNCLITGGIPIVPSFYKAMMESTDLPAGVFYYDVIDLVQPEKIQQQALEFFNDHGAHGVIQRAGSAIEKYHIDSRCELILSAVDTKINGLLL